jgi:hypothetical protein
MGSSPKREKTLYVFSCKGVVRMAFAGLEEADRTAILGQGLFEDDVELALEQDGTILVRSARSFHAVLLNPSYCSPILLQPKIARQHSKISVSG